MRVAFLLLISFGLYFCCQYEAVAEQNVVLETIAFDASGNGVETVTFSLTDLNEPKIFMLKGEKPRLVIDFSNTRYRGGSKVAVEGAHLVQGIRIGMHKDPQMKTRVVIDLARQKKITWNKKLDNKTQTVLVNLLEGEQNPVEVKEEKIGAGSLQTAKAVEKKEEKSTVVSKKPDAVKEQAVKEIQQVVAENVAVQEKKESQPAGVKKVPVEPVIKKEVKERSSGKKSVVKGDSEIPSLLDVSFDATSKKGEMIIFKLDDFHPPVVSAIEKGIPRIVCDFYNMRMTGKIKGTMDVGGEYVDKIRVARHENPGKVRAVLDLVPGNDYDLQQVFFNEDNLFVLIGKI